MERINKIKQFKDLYDSVKKEPVYVIRYESTGEVIGYKPAPEILIGRVPVYKRQYVAKELNLCKKDDLFSALVGTYGERVFSNKEEAEEKAAWLNEHENELDMNDYLEM